MTDSKCAYWFMTQMDLNQYATATAQPGLSVGMINDISIPLPPKIEQQRIVKAIEKIFEQIDSLENDATDLNTIIDNTKSKILSLAIQGKLVEQDSSDEPAIELLRRINPGFRPCDTSHYPFSIPESWEWAYLGDISNYGKCTNTSVNDISPSDWVLELEDIEKETAILCSKLTKSQREINGVRHPFKKGDILYSKLRTYLNKVLIAPDNGYCSTEIIPISQSTIIDSYYLFHVLRSEYFLSYTAMCGYGVKMPRLSTDDAKKGLIPLPPLNEQKRIVAKIEELFAMLDAVKEQLTN